MLFCVERTNSELGGGVFRLWSQLEVGGAQVYIAPFGVCIRSCFYTSSRSWHSLFFLFVVSSKQHWCRIGEPSRLSNSPPLKIATDASITQHLQIQHFFRLSSSFSGCIRSPFYIASERRTFSRLSLSLCFVWATLTQNGRNQVKPAIVLMRKLTHIQTHTHKKSSTF